MAAIDASPRLGPIFLVTRRTEAMARFYDEVVGLRATSREAGHHVWYDVAGQDFALHEPRPEPGADFTPRERGSLIWFRFADVDLDRISARLRETGLPCWGPYEGRPGPLLYALDPDENMVGLAVIPPG